METNYIRVELHVRTIWNDLLCEVVWRYWPRIYLGSVLYSPSDFHEVYGDLNGEELFALVTYYEILTLLLEISELENLEAERFEVEMFLEI